MTPAEISMAIRYKKKYDSEILTSSLQFLQRTIFESARLSNYYLWNTSDIKKKLKTPEELYRFAWEKENEVAQDELTKKLLGWAQLHNLMNKNKK